MPCIYAQGGVTHSVSFDPWGARRSAQDWVSGFNNSSLALAGFTQPLTTRGYTGHEMLDDHGLIHMNGRIFDPKLARFLQADPYIQAATDTQSYNRYTYVRNNPLNATDPSGYFWNFVIAAVVSYAAGDYAKRHNIGWLASVATIVGCATMNAAICGGASFGSTYGITGNLGLAFVAGVAGAAMSGMPAATMVEKATRVLAGSMLAGGAGMISGGEFGHGVISAGIGSMTGYIFGDGLEGFAAATIVGGTMTEMTGGKFKNGAASAAFMYVVGQGVKKYGAGGAPQDASTENRRGLCASTGRCHPDDFSQSDRDGVQQKLDPIRKVTLGKYDSNKEALLAVQKSGLVELNHEYGIEFWAQIDPVSHEVYKIDTGYDMKLSYGANLIRTKGDIIYHTHPSGRGIHFGDFGSAHISGASWIFAGSKNGMDGYMNLSYQNYRKAQFIPYGQKWKNAPYCSFNGDWSGGCSL